MVSGHLDQTVHLINLDTNQCNKICVHTSIPYALSVGKHVVCAGSDQKITF